MIIRIKGGSSGICEYLEKGTKYGRLFSREDMDKRLTLNGSLSTVNDILRNFDKENKTQKYFHIVLSFKEQDIDEKTLDNINKEFKEFLFSSCLDNEFYYYSEIHYPRLKKMLDINGNFYDRFPHIHIVIPEFNLYTGKKDNPFGRVEYIGKYLSAFQNMIDEKYNLENPKNNLNENNINLKWVKGGKITQNIENKKKWVIQIENNQEVINEWKNYKALEVRFLPNLSHKNRELYKNKNREEKKEFLKKELEKHYLKLGIQTPQEQEKFFEKFSQQINSLNIKKIDIKNLSAVERSLKLIQKYQGNQQPNEYLIKAFGEELADKYSYALTNFDEGRIYENFEEIPSFEQLPSFEQFPVFEQFPNISGIERKTLSDNAQGQIKQSEQGKTEQDEQTQFYNEFLINGEIEDDRRYRDNDNLERPRDRRKGRSNNHKRKGQFSVYDLRVRSHQRDRGTGEISESVYSQNSGRKNPRFQAEKGSMLTNEGKNLVRDDQINNNSLFSSYAEKANRRANAGRGNAGVVRQVIENIKKRKEENSIKWKNLTRNINGRWLLDYLQYHYGLDAKNLHIEKNRDGEDLIVSPKRKYKVQDFLFKEMKLSWQDTKDLLEKINQTQQTGEHRREALTSQSLWNKFVRQELQLVSLSELKNRYEERKKRISEKYKKMAQNASKWSAMMQEKRKEIQEAKEEYQGMVRYLKKNPQERFLQYLYEQSLKGDIVALGELNRIYPIKRHPAPNSLIISSIYEQRQESNYEDYGNSRDYRNNKERLEQSGQNNYEPQGDYGQWRDYGQFTEIQFENLTSKIQENGSIYYLDNEGSLLFKDNYSNVEIVRLDNKEAVKNAIKIAFVRFGKDEVLIKEEDKNELQELLGVEEARLSGLEEPQVKKEIPANKGKEEKIIKEEKTKEEIIREEIIKTEGEVISQDYQGVVENKVVQAVDKVLDEVLDREKEALDSDSRGLDRKIDREDDVLDKEKSLLSPVNPLEQNPLEKFSQQNFHSADKKQKWEELIEDDYENYDYFRDAGDRER